MKNIIGPLLLIVFSTAIMCADELSDGYRSFGSNDITQARLHFTAATTTPSTQAEAYLMLSLISTIDKDETTALRFFMEFYKVSPNPDPYLTALFYHRIFSGSDNRKSKEHIAWMQTIGERTDINSTLKAYLFECLGKYYEAIADIKTSREYLSKIGAVMDWQLAGEFQNISASGFDKNYAPISHPEPEATFRNKMDVDVQWFDLCKQIPGKWIDLTNNFVVSNTLAFAQTFCRSDAEQSVQLRIGTSGSLKVWVNDHLCFTEVEERNNGMDTYILPVRLSKGNNRILLQLGCSKIKQCNFLMRVTDAQGNLRPDLHFSTTYAPYAKILQDTAALIPSYAETFLVAQIKEHPEKLVNYLVLANTYLLNDKIHQAMDVLLKAQKIAPNCSYINYQLYEHYIRAQNKTMASLTLEKLKQIDPENRGVLDFFIEDGFKAKNEKDLHQLIGKREQLYGEDKELLFSKLGLAAMESKLDEYTPLLEKIYTQYPNDYTVVSSKFKFEKEYKNNQKGAIKLLEEFTKHNFDKEAMSALSDEYIESGEAAAGIDVLKKLIDDLPFTDSYYERLGRYYLHAGEYAEARNYFKECLHIAPYYGPYHGNYADALNESGDKANAMKEYALAIACNPDDYENIKKLRNLQSRKDIFTYFPTKDYYQMYKDAPSAAEYPSDNILSLIEEHQVVLYAEGGCETRQIMLIKALTLKGIDLLKEFTVGYAANERYTIEKAEVLKKNGNRLQAEVSDNKIVYTSLEPGDAVFLIYKKSKFVTDHHGKLFNDKWLLNTWYPSQHVDYELLSAKGLNVAYQMEHSTVKPDITDKDDFTLYTWRKDSNKGILSESYMPPAIDRSEVLNISELPSWDYLSKWYYDISNTKTKPELEVIETVNALLAGKDGLTQYQKAKILYTFIEQNIRYSSVSFRQNGVVPQKAADVLITRIGDCKDLSVLFTSMCKVAGIPAGIVLVIRRQNGENWLGLPSFEFDHAIAKANLDGKDYYVELTSSEFPFATLNESLLNAVVLEVNNDSASVTMPRLLSSATRQPNNGIIEGRVSFAGDKMSCSVSVQRMGALAVTTRGMYAHLGKEERDNKFAQAVAETYSNIKLSSLNFDTTLNDCSDTLSYNFSFVSPNVFTNLNDLAIVKLPLSEKMKPMDFMSLETRKFPIQAWRYSPYDTLSEKLTIVFPENKTLAAVPKSVHYSCNQADYSLTFAVHGNELGVVRTMVNKLDTVPVEEYSAYQTFMDSVVSADSQQIGFK